MEKNKVLCMILILLIVFSVFTFFYDKMKEKQNLENNKLEEYYQGPLQEGYNETLFRKIGKYEKSGVIQ